MFYAEYLGTRIFDNSSGTTPLDGLEFSQNFLGPVQFTVLDMSASPVAVKDMTGFTAACGIVGVDGKPIGTAGGKALAEYTSSLTLDVTNKIFSGIMDNRTSAMATLIGATDSRRSSFGAKFKSATMEFEVNCDCTLLAQRIPENVVIPSDLAGVVPAGQSQAVFPLLQTAPANAQAIAWQMSTGPGVDYAFVNALDGTVTVVLRDLAPAPDGTQVRFAIFGS